jgi:hypothetical protein
MERAVTAAPPKLLEPDRGQIDRFFDALFRHRGEEGFVSFRSFYHHNKPLLIEGVPVKSGFKYLCDVAEDHARRADNEIKPAVFCPPIALFNSKDRAREQDLLAGLVLSIECDERPQQAREKLEAILGPATAVLYSGGKWRAPEGRLQDKLHLHWRLTALALGHNLAKLKRARELATRLVGGDVSNVQIAHPMRWPGSWHRKGEPVLCQFATLEPDNEIDLDAALCALEAALPDPKGNGFDHANDDDGGDGARADWGGAHAKYPGRQGPARQHTALGSHICWLRHEARTCPAAAAGAHAGQHGAARRKMAGAIRRPAAVGQGRTGKIRQQ